jgi:NAD+ synthase (glutamine-hydrolysing)
VIDDEGELVARAPGFEEALLVVDVDPLAAVGRRLRDCAAPRALRGSEPSRPTVIDVELAPPHAQNPAGRSRSGRRSSTTSSRCAPRSSSGFATTWRRTVRATSSSASRAGSTSALTAALAAEALGAGRVHGGSMPSRYSSEGRSATRGGSPSRSRSTSASFRSSRWWTRRRALAESFAGASRPHGGELPGARPRRLLMALSNKFGWLVVATGNKSELSVGYATPYGDMAGGFALLKDVFKTDVFRLARYLNERRARS